MRRTSSRTTWLLLALAACASPPARSPAQRAPEEEPEPPDEDPPPPLTASSVVGDTSARSRPPATSSYDQAVAAPEKLDPNDERMHLTDGQLRDPIRGVLAGCRVPPNAKVTIRTAVQHGRAIGVTVDVRFEHPKSTRRPSPAATKREARAIKTVATCVDRAVRNVVWLPSSRRDTFTTEF